MDACVPSLLACEISCELFAKYFLYADSKAKLKENQVLTTRLKEIFGHLHFKGRAETLSMERRRRRMYRYSISCETIRHHGHNGSLNHGSCAAISKFN